MKPSEIISKIEDLLSYLREGIFYGSHYFCVENLYGEVVKIRVSDHSANKQNNREKTISFVTKKTPQKKSGYNQMIDEFEVETNGLTDTSQTIQEVLEWNDIF